MKCCCCFASVLIFILVCLFDSQAVAAKTLYDDFSEDYLDSNKWNQKEMVREVVSGQLVSKINAVSGSPRNRTTFINSGAINIIQADVSVVETSIQNDAGAWAQARIEGVFFNSQASGGVTGDVWASIRLTESGNGLEASYDIEETLDDDWNTTTIWSYNTIATGLSYNQAYTLKIEYDPGLHEFTFTINGFAPITISSDSLPGNVRAAVGPGKHLATGINNAVSGTNYIHAIFDNVYINDQTSAYDTFDAPLDQNKWTSDEFVCEIANDRLRLNIQGADELSQNTLSLVDFDARYVEAKAQIEGDSTLSTGAMGIFRIQGYYYNESRGPGSGQDYNGYEGDVFAQLRLQMEDDGSLRAVAMVERSDDSNQNTWTSLLYQAFASAISFDTDHIISIEYTDSSLIFTCDGETITYDIATEQYTPYGEHRALRSRVYLDPGESGYFKASVDEVYVEESDGDDSSNDSTGGGDGGGGGCFITSMR